MLWMYHYDDMKILWISKRRTTRIQIATALWRSSKARFTSSPSPIVQISSHKPFFACETLSRINWIFIKFSKFSGIQRAEYFHHLFIVLNWALMSTMLKFLYLRHSHSKLEGRSSEPNQFLPSVFQFKCIPIVCIRFDCCVKVMEKVRNVFMFGWFLSVRFYCISSYRHKIDKTFTTVIHTSMYVPWDMTKSVSVLRVISNFSPSNSEQKKNILEPDDEAKQSFYSIFFAVCFLIERRDLKKSRKERRKTQNKITENIVSLEVNCCDRIFFLSKWLVFTRTT